MMKWKRIFEECDVNKRQRIDREELGIAIKEKLKYNISDKTLDLMHMRYNNRNGTVNVDDFFTICSKLDTTTSSYSRIHDADEVCLDSYLMESLYA